MIAALGVSLLAVIGFCWALWRTRLAAVAERAADQGMAGVMAVLDPELGDDAKEVAVRRAGLGLVGASFGIAWRFALALAAVAPPILAADGLGLASRDRVLQLMTRLDWILAVTALSIAVAMLLRRLRPVPIEDAADGARYSRGDRMLHAIAFASPRVLRTASRLEDRILSTGADTTTAPPIFVASLARAGTTALLNALHDLPGVATHTYRDMPFVTAPTLWNRLAGGKRRQAGRHERAHGDGLEIGLDSPEAFEEVIWKLYWPEKYHGPTIRPWRSNDRQDDAEQFLAHHMEKVVHARAVQRIGEAAPTRYCSKNNTNIARLPLLPQAFPGCRIVVPIRRPASHAASLRRQHENFSRLQAEDDFVRRYMRDIGHFEFGLIHKPIEFPGFDPERHDPATDDYWLDYWIHAFRTVLDHSEACILVAQDDLRSTPDQTMTTLCDELELKRVPGGFATYFLSTADESPSDRYDPQLRREAAYLYRELSELAVSPEGPAPRWRATAA